MTKIPPAVAELADQVAIELARRILGERDPIYITAAELPIVIRLGQGKTTAEIGFEVELARVDVSNRILRLLRRERINRTRLSVYGALLAIGTRNGTAI